MTSAVTTGVPITFGVLSTNTDSATYDSRQGHRRPRPSSSSPPAPRRPPTRSGSPRSATTACTAGSAVTASQCRQVAVSNLIVNDPSIQKYLALGDLQYENGTSTDFLGPYDASYGRVKAKTVPTVGNHEYGTAGRGRLLQLLRCRGRRPDQGLLQLRHRRARGTSST